MWQMNDYRSSLKTVGIVLIVVGVLGIGWMLYCLAHGTDYSSGSFYPFAGIAGILLVRGGLKTANRVAFFSAWIMSTIIGAFLVFPSYMPIDFVLAYLKVYPISFCRHLLLPACTLILSGWFYSRLTVPSVTAAFAERYPDRATSFWYRPRNGFIVGAAIAIVLGGGLGFKMSHNATAAHAQEEAELKVGSSYKYYVRKWEAHPWGDHMHFTADVKAYNLREIKNVIVEWDE